MFISNYFRLGFLSALLHSLSLSATADSAPHFYNEVNCFESLYKAKINPKNTLAGYIKVSVQATSKNQEDQLYLVDSERVFLCQLPSKAAKLGQGYKSYDVALQLDTLRLPLQISHTIQYNNIDFGSTIGRIQRLMASKVYTPVHCKKQNTDFKRIRGLILEDLKLNIKKAPDKFATLTKGDKDLLIYPSEISEKFLKAQKACQGIPEMEQITQRQFENIPRY